MLDNTENPSGVKAVVQGGDIDPYLPRISGEASVRGPDEVAWQRRYRCPGPGPR